MTEKEFREIREYWMNEFRKPRVMVKESWEETEKHCKKTGLIEQTPLEKWDEWIKDTRNNSIGADMANAMRDYLLSELEAARKQRVGCGKYLWTVDKCVKCFCGDTVDSGMLLCGDCLKRMRDGK